MNLYLRSATKDDLDDIHQIFVEAQAFMASYGNPQWPKGFPDRMDILGGILGGVLYVACDEDNDDKVVGQFSTLIHDEDYENLSGRWLEEGNYLAVHRMAVRSDYRGKGVATFLVHEAERLAYQMERTSVRFDTHITNKPMIALLERNGYTFCGTITILRDGSSRNAYEKCI